MHCRYFTGFCADLSFQESIWPLSALPVTKCSGYGDIHYSSQLHYSSQPARQQSLPGTCWTPAGQPTGAIRWIYAVPQFQGMYWCMQRACSEHNADQVRTLARADCTLLHEQLHTVRSPLA